MNLRTLTILIIINLSFTISNSVFAQQIQIDSLKQVIITSREDTNKIKTLNTLAIKYQRINLDTSLIYAEQSLELALIVTVGLSYKPFINSHFWFLIIR